MKFSNGKIKKKPSNDPILKSNSIMSNYIDISVCCKKEKSLLPDKFSGACL